MLLKTKGIVLRFVKYKESSIIATIYTSEKGIISVIANSVRSKKGKIALYQPLSLVDLVVYFNDTKNINRISEISSFHPLHNLRKDPIKASISIFITEILNKCLKEEEGHSAFFEFIKNSIIHLNEQTEEVENFHLIFLVKLSLFLGFKPHSAHDFVHQLSNVSFYTDQKSRTALETLLNASYDLGLNISGNFRNVLLNDLLEYYKNHLEIGEIKSIEVLHELLHE